MLYLIQILVKYVAKEVGVWVESQTALLNFELKVLLSLSEISLYATE